MITRIYTSIILGLSAVIATAAPSILDVKHTLSDDNVIVPESFETKTHELQENFYLKNYTVPGDTGTVLVGSPKEYEDLLSRLPVEIEMPYNPLVGKFIDMYLGKRRGLVANMLSLHNYYGKIFVEELIKEGLPLELQYLPVIESALNPNAVSRAGACGLWQFMPATATGLGMEVNSLVDQRRDPRESSRAAAKYLKQLYNIYNDWSLAIAAYNCGPGNVNKALRRAGGGKKDFWEIYNYLLPETRGYFPVFIAANYVMTYHDKYGIRPTVVTKQLVTDTVEVSQRVHFNQISNVLNIPIEEIRMLNPQFRKDIIPGDNHPYQLVLPSMQCLSYIVSEDAILSYDADQYARRTFVEPGVQRSQESDLAAADSTGASTERIVKKTHLVKRGENLRSIARKYGVSATDIKRWNNLRRGKVKSGDVLAIEIVETVTPAVAKAADKSVANSYTGSDAPRPAAPDKVAKKEVKAKPTFYTVKAGDNLGRIARKHGISVNALRQANGMSAGTTRVNVGQKLKIPAKGSSVEPVKAKGKRAKAGKAGSKKGKAKAGSKKGKKKGAKKNRKRK